MTTFENMIDGSLESVENSVHNILKNNLDKVPLKEKELTLFFTES
jgi:hypothetical protein